MNGRLSAALAAIRDAKLPDGEDGPPLVEAPASVEHRAWIEECLRTSIPSELAGFLDLTTRFVVGSAQLDFEAEGFADARDLGLGDIFRVYDYGNGDGLYLEPGEPTCRLWWFGHDSWPCTLVARSLTDYVERCAEFATQLAVRAPEPRAPYEPLAHIRPARRDAETMICDFRGTTTPVGVDDVEGQVVPIARSGEVVFVKRMRG